MSFDMKHIDAEHLRKEVKRLEKAAHKSALGCADRETRKFHEGKDYAYQHVGVLIDSLQQEQQDFPTTDEQMKEFLATHPKIKIPEKYKNPDWLFKKQEKPEVDLEKEVSKWWDTFFPEPDFKFRKHRAHIVTNDEIIELACHFYELGLKARKEE